MTVKVTAIAEKDFFSIASVRDFPDDLLIFQMEGSSENLCREICRLLHGRAKEMVIEGGFYRGLASLVCLDQLGGKCLNHTAQGRLLAIEMERQLDEQTYTAIETLAKRHGLYWFSASGNLR